MTDKEAMRLALEALETLMIERESIYEKAITALKERLADPMREVQRLGQEIEQEPLIGCVNHDCAKCKEQSEQEPVAWKWRVKNFCDWPNWSVSLKRPADSGHAQYPRTEGYEDIPLYTHPPERTMQETLAWPCLIDSADFSANTITIVMQCDDYKVSAGKHWLSTTPPQRTEPVSDDIASILAFRDMLDAQPVSEVDRINWPQRTWVGLTDDEVKHEWGVWKASLPRYVGFAKGIEAKLKQKNGFAEEKNAICSPFMISELWKLHK